jgi:alanine racemase
MRTLPEFSRIDAESYSPAEDARPAWVAVDFAAMAGNFRAIRAALGRDVRLMHVVKDEAYGAGSVASARTSLENGADELAVFTLGEGLALRRAGLLAPILLLGERAPGEFEPAIAAALTPCIGSVASAEALNAAARSLCVRVGAHIKVNSGMNRFGLPWRDPSAWGRALARMESVDWDGALSHFAQSDETDKTFARIQTARFHAVMEALAAVGIRPKTRHLANSGAFLDLPETHLDMVRVGILGLGVYPSAVCRRLPGLEPVLSLHARIAAVQLLEPGDTVGYGMRFKADGPRRIAVLPLGYGDGFPRVRNEGRVIIRNAFAPLVGGVSMDALTVDVTGIPDAAPGDEAVLMGRRGDLEITAHEVAALKRSVSYDVLAGLRSRLPRRPAALS